MTNPAANPFTGVYSISTPPVKADANNRGDVLWFTPEHGWYRCWFGHKPLKGTSHWARIPDEPKVPTVVDVVAERDAAFKRWLDQFPTQLDPTAVALLRSGFDGGYTYRGQP
jgi:hypothetical protein